MPRNREAGWKPGSKTFIQGTFRVGLLLGLESNHFRENREWARLYKTAMIGKALCILHT